MKCIEQVYFTFISEPAKKKETSRLATTGPLCHYSDVIVGAMASQITSLTIIYSTVIQVQIKENIKAPRHWPLCGELTGHWWIPRTWPVTRKIFLLMTSSCWNVKQMLALLQSCRPFGETTSTSHKITHTRMVRQLKRYSEHDLNSQMLLTHIAP